MAGRTQPVHLERHQRSRLGFLRAAVLGANDGIVSTGALVIGVAAANSSLTTIVVAGVAGVVAGALSMAVGEYSSVSAQRDSENADREKESRELETEPEHELEELARIYQRRGLSKELSAQVAVAMHEHDALTAHLRDELGITELTEARPVQAAVSSAIAFAAGAALPLSAISLTPESIRVGAAGMTSLVALGFLGAWGAKLGGASTTRAIIRVMAGGSAAMVVSALIGKLVGVAV